MLAYLLLRLTQRRSLQILIISAVGVMVAAIGFSRLYLGVHYFSDIVGGYAAGLLWLAACISGLEIVRRRSPGESHVAGNPGTRRLRTDSMVRNQRRAKVSANVTRLPAHPQSAPLLNVCQSCRVP